MSDNTDQNPGLTKIRNRLLRDNTHEGWAIDRELLQFTRWGGRQNNVGIFEAPSLIGISGKLFYRTMKKTEFDVLYGKSKLNPPGYGGITDTRAYAESYLQISATGNKTKEAGTHTVEFWIHEPIDLEAELKQLGLTAKAEEGAMSYGLGPEQLNGVGGTYFNELLVSRVATWRLVAFLENVSGKR